MESSILNTFRRYRNALATGLRSLLGRSDLKRWTKLSALSPEWDERNRLIATLIEPGSSVLEFGAGRMVLKELLPEGCTYTPSDIVDRGQGTIVCNLNAQCLPNFLPHDVLVLSGVIEYVNDVPRLIAHLAGTVKVILVSYVLVESFPNKVERRSHGWVNDFSSRELEDLFEHAGFTPTTTTNWNSHKIFKFINING